MMHVSQDKTQFTRGRMSHWERFMAAARFQPVDQVPLALIGTARYFSYMNGHSIFDFYYDPDVMIESQKKVMARFPDVTFIPGCWPDYGAGWLTGLGLKVEWPPNDTCGTRDHRYQTREEIDAIPLPDPRRDGLWPWYLKTLRRFKERGDEFPDRLHCLHCLGPGECGTYLHGITETMTEFVTDPDLVYRVFERSAEFIIHWLHAQLEVLPDAQVVLLTDDITGFSSDEQYRQLLWPHQRAIREAFPELLFIFHNDTTSDHVSESIADTGFEVYQLGHSSSLAEAKQSIGRRTALMGNLNTVETMRKGSIEDVRREARTCLEIGAPGGGFILAPGGGMNAGIAPEKIDAVVDCCREYADAHRQGR